MFIVESYFFAVIMCVITMICWGSWANTQKLASKEWKFQLFYWDYSWGVLIFTLLLALTLGSTGSEGRGFLEDLSMAEGAHIWSALLGGIVFNLANILLVAAIDIAGMAVAFPIGIGLALVIGVITNYVATPVGDPIILFIGVALVAIAIIIDAMAYGKLPSSGGKSKSKGLVLSIIAGIAGETPYETDLNVWMQLEKELKNGKPKQQNIAYVLKDRSDTINGKSFVYPTFKQFSPIVNFILGLEIGEIAKETSLPLSGLIQLFN